MQSSGSHLDFARYVASALASEPFTFLDIGCSLGIDWRFLGDNLRAFGFDPNLQEVERLRAAETSPNITYWPAFVNAPPDHPFVQLKGGRPDYTRHPWSRLAVADSIARQAEIVAQMSNQEKTIRNTWTDGVPLAQPSVSIILPEFIRRHNIMSIDFVKIDIDGKDFEVLNSLSDVIDDTKIVGFFLEVNFMGPMT